MKDWPQTVNNSSKANLINVETWTNITVNQFTSPLFTTPINSTKNVN